MLSSETNQQNSSSDSFATLSFNTDGFNYRDYQEGDETLVAWCFKAGGAAVSNTDGSITSQVSVNNDLGFSIVKWTGDDSSATIGHGLDVPPQIVIRKPLDRTASWAFDTTVIDGSYDYLFLNTSAAKANHTQAAPTATVFTTGGTTYNANNEEHIAYCFASKRGVSKVGSFVGTGASGKKIYTGFQPAFLLMKRTSSAGSGWYIIDNKRDAASDKKKYLSADAASAETSSSTGVTFNADGFTFNGSSFNTSGETHIYVAFAAEKPNSLIDDTDLELHLDAGDTNSYDPDTDGSTWSDISGNSRNATLTSMDANNHDKEIGGWFDVVKTADYVTIPYNAALVPTSTGYTFEGWYNFDEQVGGSHWSSVFGNWDESVNADGMLLRFKGANVEFFVYENNSSVFSSTGTASGVSTNEWFHIVMTMSTNASGGAVKVYINGEQKISGTLSGNFNPNSTQDLFMCYGGDIDSSSSRYFDGKVGQGRIYSTALTADEVMQNYRFTKNDYPNGFNGTIYGASHNPSGYFSFDGTNDYVDTSLVLKPNNTISFWVNFSSTSGTVIEIFGASVSTYNWIYCGIVDDQDSAHNDYEIYLWIRQDSSKYNYQKFTNVTLNSYGNWNFITFRMEELNGTNFYMSVNGGAEQQSVTHLSSGTITALPNDGINIGRAHSNGTWSYGNCKISKFKVHDKALTSGEITALNSEGE